jgi:hypothetical protein
MGALKPWHLVICLLVVIAIVGVVIAVARSGRRR